MAALFALITGWSINATDAQPGINQAVLNALQALRSPFADHLMVIITALADRGPMTLLVLTVLGWLLLNGQRRTALYWLAAAGFALISGPLLKLLLQIPRPSISPVAAGSYAFPSGHTLWASVIFAFLAVVVARGLSLRRRWHEVKPM